MLIDKRDTLQMLRCPKLGSALKAINNHLIAVSKEEKCDYEIIEGFPVLIDFERSVLNKEDINSLSSIIKRYSYSGLGSNIKRLVSPAKPITAENVEDILSLLFKKNDSTQKY